MVQRTCNCPPFCESAPYLAAFVATMQNKSHDGESARIERHLRAGQFHDGFRRAVRRQFGIQKIAKRAAAFTANDLVMGKDNA